MKPISLDKKKFMKLGAGLYLVLRPERDYDHTHLVGTISADPIEKEQQWKLIKKSGTDYHQCETYSDLEEYQKEIKEILPVDISSKTDIQQKCAQTTKMLEDLAMSLPTNRETFTQFQDMIATINRYKNMELPK